MISFACPGCQKAFKVAPEKAGKTGRCPQCATAFTIPNVAGDAAPSAPASTDPVEIAPCPKCAMALTVGPEHLGQDVECPGCKTVFAAIDKNKTASSKVAAPSKRSVVDDEDDRPSKKNRRREDDDEDDRPARKSRRRDDDDEDEDERPSRRASRRRDDDEDEDDDRPRRKKKRRREIDPADNKRVTAGILALLIGWLGIHKFILGYTGAGIIQILLSLCTGIGMVIPVVEGIIYLTKTDEEFYDTYVRGTKEWF